MGRKKKDIERLEMMDQIAEEIGGGLFGDDLVEDEVSTDELKAFYAVKKTPLHFRAMLLLDSFPIGVGSRIAGGVDTTRECVIQDDYTMRDTQTDEVYPSLSAAARGLNANEYEAIDYRSGKQRKVFPDGWKRTFFTDPSTGKTSNIDDLFFNIEAWGIEDISVDTLSTQDKLYQALASRGLEDQIKDLKIKAPRKKQPGKSGS